MRFRRLPQSHRHAIHATLAIVLTALIGLATRPWELSGSELTAADELLAHAKYLASPELAGRGVNTPGIKLGACPSNHHFRGRVEEVVFL